MGSAESQRLRQGCRPLDSLQPWFSTARCQEWPKAHPASAGRLLGSGSATGLPTGRVLSATHEAIQILKLPQREVSPQLSLTRHSSLHIKMQAAAVKSIGFACGRLAYFLSRPSLSAGALPFATSLAAFLGRTVHPPSHKISKSHSRRMTRSGNRCVHETSASPPPNLFAKLSDWTPSRPASNFLSGSNGWRLATREHSALLKSPNCSE